MDVKEQHFRLASSEPVFVSVIENRLHHQFWHLRRWNAGRRGYRGGAITKNSNGDVALLVSVATIREEPELSSTAQNSNGGIKIPAYSGLSAMRFEGVRRVLKLKNYRAVVGVGREIFEIKLIHIFRVA